MIELIVILGLGLGLVYIVYLFFIKPIVIKAFYEGLNEKKKSKPAPQKKTISPEISKEKGDKFEEYIVKKFDPEYFTIREWRGDKYIEGLYAKSILNPDLEIEFRFNNFSHLFAVECKYRQNSHNGEIEFAKERQIHHYKNFEHERRIPVYIALGLGGSPENPAELFIIPLQHLSTNKISTYYISQFKKKTEGHFHFNIQEKTLN